MNPQKELIWSLWVWSSGPKELKYESVELEGELAQPDPLSNPMP